MLTPSPRPTTKMTLKPVIVILHIVLLLSVSLATEDKQEGSRGQMSAEVNGTRKVYVACFKSVVNSAMHYNVLLYIVLYPLPQYKRVKMPLQIMTHLATALRNVIQQQVGLQSRKMNDSIQETVG